ncbi:hypothetical protein AgCh_027924 [Apium graveolens]
MSHSNPKPYPNPSQQLTKDLNLYLDELDEVKQLMPTTDSWKADGKKHCECLLEYRLKVNTEAAIFTDSNRKLEIQFGCIRLKWSLSGESNAWSFGWTLVKMCTGSVPDMPIYPKNGIKQALPDLITSQNDSCQLHQLVCEGNVFGLRDLLTKIASRIGINSMLMDKLLFTWLVDMGSSRASILGEGTINLVDYADASNPSSIAMPLNGCNYGAILHVSDNF